MTNFTGNNYNTLTELVSPSKEDFMSAVSLAVPFKLLGCMSDWKLLDFMSRNSSISSKCSYLCDISGKEIVNYTIGGPELLGSLRINEKLEPNFSFKSKRTTFKRFLEDVQKYVSNPELGVLYLQSTPLKKLTEDIWPLSILEGFSPASYPNYWIGSGNHAIGLHNDPFRNMIGMFSGKKTIILLPPEQLPNLYPAPFDKRVGSVIASLVDVFNPDLQKFPKYSRALESAIHLELEPGEILYMPPLWWHAVKSTGFNVSMNSWFFDDSDIKRVHHAYFPAQKIFRKIDHTKLSIIDRKYQYKYFNNIFESSSKNTPLQCKDQQVIRKEAEFLNEIIYKSNLLPAQKDIWVNWVQIFMKWYGFRLSGEPFPTLGKGAFFSMIRRMRIKHLLPKLEIFQMLQYYFITFFKLERVHGLVPTRVFKFFYQKNDVNKKIIFDLGSNRIRLLTEILVPVRSNVEISINSYIEEFKIQGTAICRQKKLKYGLYEVEIESHQNIVEIHKLLLEDN